MFIQQASHPRNEIRFAYRSLDREGGIPLAFKQPFNGTLDNWDPTVTDGLAKEREAILFNAGVASSTGEVPKTFAEMYNNAEAFIDALGLKQVDIFSFSIKGQWRSSFVLDRPEARQAAVPF